MAYEDWQRFCEEGQEIIDAMRGSWRWLGLSKENGSDAATVHLWETPNGVYREELDGDGALLRLTLLEPR